MARSWPLNNLKNKWYRSEPMSEQLYLYQCWQGHRFGELPMFVNIYTNQKAKCRTCVCKVFSMTHTVCVVDLSLILDLEVWQCLTSVDIRWPLTSPQHNRDQVLIMVTYIQSMKLIWLGMVDFVCLHKTKQMNKITQNLYFWTNLRSGPPTQIQ